MQTKGAPLLQFRGMLRLCGSRLAHLCVHVLVCSYLQGPKVLNMVEKLLCVFSLLSSSSFPTNSEFASKLQLLVLYQSRQVLKKASVLLVLLCF